MRKLILWNLITLDGYFEGEKAWDLDFHGLVWGDELEQFVTEQLKSVEMLVFGDTTYQGMAEYWTKEEGEVAEYMNALPKIVCSTTRIAADWHNTTIVRDAVTELAELKKGGEGNLFVFGSADLSGSLMKAGLFDEYRLCIVPVILGSGTRLFKEGVPYQKLALLEDRQLQTGGVIVRYE